MASSQVSSQGTESVQTTVPTSNTCSTSSTYGDSSGSGHPSFNIGLAFCQSSGDLSDATAWVVATNASTVDFMVQWESDVMDTNNAALEAQADEVGKYTDKDDSGKQSEESTKYSQMSQEAQDQTNQMSSEQTTLNNAGENEMSFSQSWNSMVKDTLSSLQQAFPSWR
jgi:glyceraldehyde-3-phosphate dehydrogenase/erythrose-4-phosphate dehydrogenase